MVYGQPNSQKTSSRWVLGNITRPPELIRYPPELIRYPPDLCIYILYLFNVLLGPSSVFQVGGRDPRFTLRGPWSGRLAAMHPAPVPSGDDGVLARRAFARFCMAPLARPMGPEPCATARFNEFISVN